MLVGHACLTGTGWLADMLAAPTPSLGWGLRIMLSLLARDRLPLEREPVLRDPELAELARFRRQSAGWGGVCRDGWLPGVAIGV